MRTLRESLLARQVGALWAAEVVALCTGLIQAVVVARILGPQQFGTASLILGTTVLVFSLLDPKAQDAVVKYLATYHASGQRTRALAVAKVGYASSLLLALAGFGAMVTLAPWLSVNVAHSDDAFRLFIVFAGASTFAAPLATSRAILITFRRFSTVGVLQAGGALLRTILTVGFVAASPSVDGVIYATSISVVVESVCAVVIAQRQLRSNLGGGWWQARPSVLGEDLSAMIRFLLYTDLQSLLAAIVREADLVVLGYVRGPSEAGYYRLARSAAQPMASLLAPLQQVVYPRLTVMAAGDDNHEFARTIRRYTLGLGLPIAGISLLALPLLPGILPAVAGTAYRPAVDAAMILLGGAALLIPAFWAEPALLARGQVRPLVLITFVAATSTLVAYFLLGELIGDIGVAAARVGIAGLGATCASALYCVRRLERPVRISETL